MHFVSIPKYSMKRTHNARVIHICALKLALNVAQQHMREPFTFIHRGMWGRVPRTWKQSHFEMFFFCFFYYFEVTIRTYMDFSPSVNIAKGHTSGQYMVITQCLGAQYSSSYTRKQQRYICLRAMYPRYNYEIIVVAVTTEMLLRYGMVMAPTRVYA